MHGLNTIIKSNNDMVRDHNIAQALVANRELTFDQAQVLVQRYDEAVIHGDIEEMEAIELANPELEAEFARTKAAHGGY